jgi:uncharacterized membrane protein YhaH (DUF805 family)
MIDFGHAMSFKPGTLNRGEYFARWIVCTTVSFIAGMCFQSGDSLIPLAIFLTCATMLYSIVGIVARLNDIGHSGWMVLLLFIPLVNIFFGLYIFCASSKKVA